MGDGPGTESPSSASTRPPSRVEGEARACPATRSGSRFGSGSVWVGSRYGDRVTRFNARTNKRQARIRVGSGPYAVAYGAGARLGHEREPRHRQPDRPEAEQGGQDDPRRRPPERRSRVAFGSVWVADSGGGELIRIEPPPEPRRGSVGTVRTPTGSRVSAARSGSRARPARSTGIDPATLAVTATVTVGANPLASACDRPAALGVRTSTRGTVSVVEPGSQLGDADDRRRREPDRVADAPAPPGSRPRTTSDLWPRSISPPRAKGCRPCGRRSDRRAAAAPEGRQSRSAFGEQEAEREQRQRGEAADVGRRGQGHRARRTRRCSAKPGPEDRRPKRAAAARKSAKKRRSAGRGSRRLLARDGERERERREDLAAAASTIVFRRPAPDRVRRRPTG